MTYSCENALSLGSRLSELHCVKEEVLLTCKSSMFLPNGLPRGPQCWEIWQSSSYYYYYYYFISVLLTLKGRKWGGFREKMSGLLACPLIGSSPLLPHLALTTDPRDAPVNFSKHCSSELMLRDICFSILRGSGGSRSDICLIEDNDEERRMWTRSLCACFTFFFLKHRF